MVKRYDDKMDTKVFNFNDENEMRSSSSCSDGNAPQHLFNKAGRGH